MNRLITEKIIISATGNSEITAAGKEKTQGFKDIQQK